MLAALLLNLGQTPLPPKPQATFFRNGGSGWPKVRRRELKKLCAEEKKLEKRIAYVLPELSVRDSVKEREQLESYQARLAVVQREIAEFEEFEEDLAYILLLDAE